MLPRTLSRTIKNASENFPVLLLTGPRQVGKTTLLEAMSGKNRRYVSLDDLEQRNLALNDPALFLQTHTPPVIIDEVQYAPGLFPYIKMYVDRHKKPGDFWLTGSQKFHLMKGIRETMAGRVAIIDLLGLSYAEMTGMAGKSVPFLPSPERTRSSRNNPRDPLVAADVYKIIFNKFFQSLTAMINPSPSGLIEHWTRVSEASISLKALMASILSILSASAPVSPATNPKAKALSATSIPPRLMRGSNFSA